MGQPAVSHEVADEKGRRARSQYKSLAAGG